MKNLLNFFFSFDKLFKEKLVVPFFWLSIIFFGLWFLVLAVDAVRLDPLNWIIVPVSRLVLILLTLVFIRIVSELIVAVFRINDNLSPDKGKSELADIDPMAEARKAAELAAARTRETTKTLGEKASAATKTLGKNVDEMASNVQSKAKSVVKSSKEKITPEPKPEPKVTKVEKADITPDPAPKKRGRPKGSTNKTTSTSKAKTAPKTTASKSTTKKKTTTKKTTASKPTAKSSTTAKKRGPKPGQKILRDADGNLLKKDGTPRKKPGPKKK